MSSIVHKRKETAYHKAVSQIIAEEITNVNISSVTVTGVKLSGDSSHLNVYVTFEDNKDRSMENLLKTAGYVRTRLAHSSVSRKVPSIHFKHDVSQEAGARIDEILKKIKKTEK